VVVLNGGPTRDVRVPRAHLEVCIRGEESIGGVGTVNDPPTPDRTGRKGLQVKPCNDTEIILASFESCKEIEVGGCVCIDDTAIGEDDFEVYDAVARPAPLGAEEGYAA